MSDTLYRDILAQIEGLKGRELSDEERNKIVEQARDAVLSDPSFAKEWERKMRFGGDRELAGTKYAGMEKRDLEYLHALQVGLRGQRAPRGGVYTGPSEDLTRAIEEVFAGKRAMDTAESGYGSQLIGAQYVPQLWEVARREARIFSLLRNFPMSDPTAYLPVEVDFPEALFVSESTANNSSNYDTVKTGSQRVQVDAKKFVIHQMWSGEMEEDSIIPFLPFLSAQAAKSVAHYNDSLVMNGDTTNAGTGNINLDDADPADTKHYLALDGIRHAAIVDNTNNKVDVAGAITFDALIKNRSLMRDTTRFVDWGHPNDPMDLVYACDPETADRIALLDEVITVDKLGPGATVVTGQQGKVGAHPLVASEVLSKTEADGKVSTTGSNNTKGQVVIFNRNGFVVGTRRTLQVETERLPATDQTRLVYSWRLGLGRFTPTGAASGIEAAAVLYNISL